MARSSQTNCHRLGFCDRCYAGLKSDAPTSLRDGVDQEANADQGLMAKILKSLVGLVLGGYPKTPPVFGPFQTIGIEELAICTDYRLVMRSGNMEPEGKKMFFFF